MSIPLSTRQTWSKPILIAVFSAVGLFSALLGDGGWDVLSWFALGVPVTVVIWYAGVRSSSGWPKVSKRA